MAAEFATEAMRKLQHLEGLTWQMIKQQTHGTRGKSSSHSLSVADALTAEAQARAQEINLQEDELFSLRLSGKQRIIGVRRGSTLEIVWYDRDHKVAKSGRN